MASDDDDFGTASEASQPAGRAPQWAPAMAARGLIRTRINVLGRIEYSLADARRLVEQLGPRGVKVRRAGKTTAAS